MLLAIETSTSLGGVAVVALDGRTLPEAKRTYDGTRGHAEYLLFAVDEALAIAGAQRGDVVAVAVGVGPGSFTGVRTAVATAKGLALGQGAKLVAATTLELLAAARAFPGTRVALLDAKREQVYAGAFDAALAPIGDAALLGLDELPAWLASLPSPLLLLGDAAAVVRAPAGAIVAPSAPDAGVLARLGAARFAAGAVADAATLEPAYLRAPDVTRPSRGAPIG